MALIPTQTLSVAGTAPTFAAAANGDTTRVGAHLTLIVKNTSGSPVNVTLTPTATLATGATYPPKVYAVPATTGEMWIPLLDVYADATTLQAAITYSATTNVTRAVVASV